MTPATTGPLLTPTLSFIETLCSMACSRVMWTMRMAMRTMRSAWLATGIGQAAHRHIGVAHRLDLLDAEILGGDVEAREQPVEQRHDVLRRHLRRQRGEADQVGEGDRDLGEAVGDPLLAAAQPVGDRRRQDVEQQLLVLAVLVLDHDVLLAQIRRPCR